MIVINSRIDKISNVLHRNKKKYGKMVYLDKRSLALLLNETHAIGYFVKQLFASVLQTGINLI